MKQLETAEQIFMIFDTVGLENICLYLWLKSDKNKRLLHEPLYAPLHIFREQVVKYLSEPKKHSEQKL